jgi:hypothetical protein
MIDKSAISTLDNGFVFHYIFIPTNSQLSTEKTEKNTKFKTEIVK